MQLNLRRAIITLLWAGLIVAAGPAIGYAEGASERLSVQSTVREQPSDISADQSATSGLRDDVAEYAN